MKTTANLFDLECCHVEDEYIQIEKASAPKEFHVKGTKLASKASDCNGLLNQESLDRCSSEESSSLSYLSSSSEMSSDSNKEIMMITISDIAIIPIITSQSQEGQIRGQIRQR